MNRHTSSIDLRAADRPVSLAQRALEQLYVVLDDISSSEEPLSPELASAARDFWLALVFDLAELEDGSTDWPWVDEVDLARVARRASRRYHDFVDPLLDFGLPRHLAVRNAIQRIVDVLEPVVEAHDAVG